MPVIVNDPEVKILHPISNEVGKAKMSYNLAPPIGVHTMNYARPPG